MTQVNPKATPADFSGDPPQCPMCGTVGKPVSYLTVSVNLFKEHKRKVFEEGVYHFCPGQRCEMVYFGEGRTFFTKDIKKRVTLKDKHLETPICYCYNIQKGDVLKELEETGQTRVLELMREKGKKGVSNCERTSPSGSCCFDTVLWWLESIGAPLDFAKEKERGCALSGPCLPDPDQFS